MRSRAQFINKLNLLFGRKRYRKELDEEMAFHRQQTQRELVEDGIEPEAARYQAMRRFGNSTRIKQRSHEIVEFKLETVVEDLRFALRQFRRNPGFDLSRSSARKVCAMARTMWLRLSEESLPKGIFPG